MSILSSTNSGRFKKYREYFENTWPNKFSNIEFEELADSTAIAILEPKYNYESFYIDCSSLPCKIRFTNTECIYNLLNFQGNFDKVREMQKSKYELTIYFAGGKFTSKDLEFIKYNSSRITNSEFRITKDECDELEPYKDNLTRRQNKFIIVDCKLQ